MAGWIKTYKYLYPQIYQSGNLVRTWRKARGGMRYTAGAATFERNLDTELVALKQELADETHQPGGHRSFTVYDPKRRKISAAPFGDRIVHGRSLIL